MNFKCKDCGRDIKDEEGRCDRCKIGNRYMED